jgi:hypothetical protein
MNDTVLLTREGPVATLTLNRPDALNSLDPAMIEALVSALQRSPTTTACVSSCCAEPAGTSWQAATSARSPSAWAKRRRRAARDLPA